MVKVERNAGRHTLRVLAGMNIYNAAAIKQALLDGMMDAEEEVELDLSAVGEIDSSGVQLLVVLGREAGSRGMGLRVSSHSQATKTVFDLYRLPDDLEGQ